jgi:hypothetical protein
VATKELGSTPRGKPAGMPRDRQGSTYRDVTLNAVIDLERTVGGLETAIGTLEERSADQGRKLDTISKQIYAALAFLAVLSAIGALILNKLGDLAVAIGAAKIVTH